MPDLSSSGVPQNAVAVLTGFYKDAAARLGEIVLHPPGKTQAARDFRMARASGLVHRIDAVVRTLDAQASKWIGERMPSVVANGVKAGIAQAAAVGVRPEDSPIAGSFNQIDHATVATFAADTYGDLSKASGSMGETAKTVLRHTSQMGLGEAEINRILAGGVIDGEPVATIRQLRVALEAVHGKKVIVKGREFDTAYYASLVARTKTREATVKARHDRLESLGLDLVAITGLVSKNFCTAFLGQVFSLGGKSSQYPAYDSLPGGGPPFHPNCSKSTRPFVAALASDNQLEMAKGVDGANDLLGKNATFAQRAFKDLNIHAQVKRSYGTTEKKLYGAAA